VDDAELTKQIKDVFIQVLDLPLDRDQLDDGMSLYSPFIQMDSMALLHLLVACEERFDIDIDDEDVMNADFTTVASLVDMIRDEVVVAAGDRGAARHRPEIDGPD
jgi:acyl carrier protein